MFSRYQSVLTESNQIDFNDMINLADVSISQFNLIKELKNQTNTRVMVVGDDWQSIYRFTGSDIDLFTSFEKYFGF